MVVVVMVGDKRQETVAASWMGVVMGIRKSIREWVVLFPGSQEVG